MSIFPLIINIVLITIACGQSFPAQEDSVEIIEKNPEKKFRVNSEEVGQYEKFELSFRLPKRYHNPFDPREIDIRAHFISPSGQEESWPAFWYQDYDKETKTRKVTRRGNTKIVSRDFYYPKGEPEWKVRFAPKETGEYKYYLTIKEGQSNYLMRYPKDGSMFSFNSVKSDNKGYIKVSDNDSDYFSYESGETFFPIGHGPILNIEKLEKYSSYNMNIVQTEFNYDFMIEHTKVGIYDLVRAFKADNLLKLAEELGIYLQIVFESWPKWAENKPETGGNVYWTENAYNRVNGGPINYPLQFDSDKAAKQYFKNRLRYSIARWGYSGNIFSWHLWGEYDIRMNMASTEGQRYYSQEGIVSWHKEMSEYIKSCDKRHMVSTAEALIQDKSPEIWNFNAIDFITVHNYENPIDWRLPQKVREYIDFGINKPIMVQEYGPEPYIGLLSLSEEANRIGYHNPLWQTVMMKLAGAPMKWTWQEDPREDTMNLDGDYQVLCEFFKDSDLANERMEILNPVDLSLKQRFKTLNHHGKRRTKLIREGGRFSPVEIYGIGSGEKAYLWIHDLRYNLYEIQNTDYRPQIMVDIKFQLNNLKDEKYRVEFWDTRTGGIFEIKEVEAIQGRLIVEAPEFKKDIAVRINIRESE